MRPRLIDRRTAIHTLMLIAAFIVHTAVGQSNYASHANNIDYLGKGLPEEATLDGKVRFCFCFCFRFFLFIQIAPNVVMISNECILLIHKFRVCYFRRPLFGTPFWLRALWHSPHYCCSCIIMNLCTFTMTKRS